MTQHKRVKVWKHNCTKSSIPTPKDIKIKNMHQHWKNCKTRKSQGEVFVLCSNQLNCWFIFLQIYICIYTWHYPTWSEWNTQNGKYKTCHLHHLFLSFQLLGLLECVGVKLGYQEKCCCWASSSYPINQNSRKKKQRKPRKKKNKRKSNSETEKRI